MLRMEEGFWCDPGAMIMEEYMPPPFMLIVGASLLTMKLSFMSVSAWCLSPAFFLVNSSFPVWLGNMVDLAMGLGCLLGAVT